LTVPASRKHEEIEAGRDNFQRQDSLAGATAGRCPEVPLSGNKGKAQAVVEVVRCPPTPIAAGGVFPEERCIPDELWFYCNN